MLGWLFRKERELQENSRVGTSEFEREGGWIWPAIALGLILIWAGIKYYLLGNRF